MSPRARLAVILGLTVGLLAVVLVWRTARESDFASLPSPVLPFAGLPSFRASPLSQPAVTPPDSPLPVSTGSGSPGTMVTLEAIRAMRPTAPPPSTPSGPRLPYVSPAEWRGWALRILAAAGILAYIGFRLRRSQ